MASYWKIAQFFRIHKQFVKYVNIKLYDIILSIQVTRLYGCARITYNYTERWQRKWGETRVKHKPDYRAVRKRVTNVKQLNLTLTSHGLQIHHRFMTRR